MSIPLITAVHSIFLTREQRYALSIPEAEINVIGCYSYIWIYEGKHISKLAEEMFAKYKIYHCQKTEKHTLSVIDEGFLIKLSPKMHRYLLDYCDDGDACLSLIHKNVIIIDNVEYQAIHSINIEDKRVLTETMI